MSAMVQTANGFVLHSRPYQDNSLLVDVLTVEVGIQRFVAKGARQQKKNSLRCDPFVLCQFTYSGKSQLKTLRNCESSQPVIRLHGKPLFAALYINELLLRAVQDNEPQAEIVALYQWALLQLAAAQSIELVLRQLELQLLDTLGYGIEFSADIDGNSISPDCYYRYLPEQGFQCVMSSGDKNCFSGEHIMALAERQFEDNECLRAAKILMRLALSPLVGNKPFMSRELFVGVSQ